MMLLVSFLSGFITVLAPCVLPILPAVLGVSVSGRGKWSPYVVVGSLALSIFFITLVFKISAACAGITPRSWMYVSGIIIMLYGITRAFPGVWDRIPGISTLNSRALRLLGAARGSHTYVHDAFMGAALGPVFSTCSPTYFVIVAAVLPVNYYLGTLYIGAYILGLALALLMIGLMSSVLMKKFVYRVTPESLLMRGIGVLFIVIGVSIAFGHHVGLSLHLFDVPFDVNALERALLEWVP